MLKDFVEISKAKYSCYGEEAKLLYKKNWKYKIPFYFKYCFREPDLGIKHLLWESSLDDPSLPLDQQSPDQAVLAREVLELYIWWVKDRPSRKNIDVPTYDDQGLVMSVLDSDFDRSAEDYRAFKVVNEQQKLLEENWQEEDDNNFHRLIKIRKLLDT
jgi:hypothetical protein